MLNKKSLLEYKEEILKEGVRIHVNFDGLSVGEFAEKLLIIINYKSSFADYAITNVRTFQGTNTIEVETYHEEATMHLLKQLVDDYKQIEVYEKITVIDLTEMDLGCQLEQLGLIEEDSEFVVIGK